MRIYRFHLKGTQENLEFFNSLYGNYPAQWGYLY
jgi:hypothetical protein